MISYESMPDCASYKSSDFTWWNEEAALIYSY